MNRLLAATGLPLLASLAFCPRANAQSEVDKMQSMKEMFDSEYSEEMVYRADRLLLTATGSLLPIHKAPAVASIITAADIERMGAASLDEVLETVPGLHVAPSPINRLNSIYSIRGIHTGVNPQVLFMLNGIPVREVYSGAKLNAFRFPVKSISRIEIIRGPGSAVHGADAFAGTVNVITKDGIEIDGTEFGGRLGSFSAYDGWAQHGSTYHGWDLALGLEFQTSDGDRDRVIDTDLQTFLDAVINTPLAEPAASLAPGSLDTSYEILNANLGLSKDNWTLRFWGWLQNDAGMGDGVTNVLAPRNSFDGGYFLGDVNYLKKDLVADDLDLNLRWSYSWASDDSFLHLYPAGHILALGAAGGPPYIQFTDGMLGNPSGVEQTYNFDTTLFYAGLAKHRLRLGAGISYVDEQTEEAKNYTLANLFANPVAPGFFLVDGTLIDVTGSPDVFMDDQTRTIWHFSLQDEWSLARNWEFTAGMRYDHYSDFGSTINPRLALVWETRYDLTTKLLYGRAFRPPSFSELFLQNNPSAQGNPNLEPETIQTLELAFDYQPTTAFRSILNLFGYDIDGLIDYEPDNPADPSSSRTAQNSKDQKGYGFELETQWDPVSSLRLQANMAYQQSRDEELETTIADAPQLQFYASAQWKFLPDWQLAPQYFWIGNRSRAAGDTREEIDDYQLVNLVLKRDNLFRYWDATLAVNNLFDSEARTPSTARSYIIDDYPLPGRSISLALRCRF